MRGGWQADDPTMVHTYVLLPVSEGRSRTFRALAALEFEAAEADKRISPTPLP